MPFGFKGSGADTAPEELQRQLLRAQQEHEEFVQFVRGFPDLTRMLLETKGLREFPRLLLEILAGAFQPDVALVAVRRSALGTGPEREARFIVAAGAGFKEGEEFGPHQGMVGLATEARRVLDRKDWQSLGAGSRPAEAGGAWTRLQLAAPLAVGDEILGAVGVGLPHRRLVYGKEMLRLITQLSAYKLKSLENLYTVQSAANLDGLTQILNKRAISHKLSEAVFEAEAVQGELSVFLFDIDNFKHYNDTQGHVAGDKLLRDLAQLVRTRSRRENLFGRFGGEEFLIVLRGCETGAALIAAENVRRIIAGHPFDSAADQPLGCLSISGGVATFPSHGRSSTELLKAADAALYEAKRSGRNRVCVAS